MKILSTLLLVCLLFSCSLNDTKKVEEMHENGTPKLIRSLEKGKEKLSRFYPDGKKETEGLVEQQNIKNGVWKYWYEDGTLWSQSTYVNGVKEGPTEVYYTNSKLRYKGHFSNDKPVGKWIFYNANGEIEKEINYDE